MLFDITVKEKSMYVYKVNSKIVNERYMSVRNIRFFVFRLCLTIQIAARYHDKYSYTRENEYWLCNNLCQQYTYLRTISRVSFYRNPEFLFYNGTRRHNSGVKFICTSERENESAISECMRTSSCK